MTEPKSSECRLTALELVDDPLVRMLMRADRVEPDDLRRLITDLRPSLPKRNANLAA